MKGLATVWDKIFTKHLQIEDLHLEYTKNFQNSVRQLIKKSG
jgi:hypothetical protein